MGQEEGSVGKVFVWNPKDQNDASQKPCKKQGPINTCAKEKETGGSLGLESSEFSQLANSFQ